MNETQQKNGARTLPADEELRALRESEARYRALFETMGQSYALLELCRDEAGNAVDTRFLELNSAVERLIGRASADFIGRLTSEVSSDTPASLWGAYDKVVRSGESTRFEEYFPSSKRWYEILAVPAGGDRVAVLYDDVTARKLATDARRESEARRELSLAAANMGTFVWYIEGDRGELDARILVMFGQPPDGELNFTNALKLIHPDDLEGYTAAVAEAMKPDGSRELCHDIRVKQPGGGWRWIEITATASFDAAGRPLRMAGTGIDVTARKTAEAALRESKERQAFLLKLADALRPLNDPVEIRTEATRVLGEHLGMVRVQYWEAEADGEHLVSDGGYANGLEFISGRYRIDDFGSQLRPALTAGQILAVANVSADPRVGETELAAFKAFGVSAYIAVPLVKDGRLVAVLGAYRAETYDWPEQEISVIQEVAERTWATVQRARAEAELRESETRFRAVQDTSIDGFMMLDAVRDAAGAIVDFRWAHGNAAAGRILNRPAGYFIGRLMLEEMPGIREQGLFDAYRRVVETGEPWTREFAYDGDGYSTFVRLVVAKTGDGFAATFADLSERRRAEERLIESEERYRTLFEAIDAGFCIFEMKFDGNDRAVDYRFIDVNPAFGRQTGLTGAQGKWISELAPGNEQYWYDLYGQVATTGESARFENYAQALGRYYEIYAFRVGLPEQHRVAALFNDITARRQAEAALQDLNATLAEKVAAAVAERETALAQLHEMQKLETIGQLTGGVAHDFNNLLTPIVGALDMMRRKLEGDERSQRLIAGAQQSAERARVLISRLLTFARRQHLEPRSVDVAEIARGMEDLVARSIGPQVVLVLDVPDGLPPARVDPNQLELALLNLCVNARDAMPGGGRITVAADAADAAEAHAPQLMPGRYVRLWVTDTGVGMDPETLRRAVEPFYSTKGVGKGTGLGLSMAHGLAGQSGGALQLRSRPGAGTTAIIWLPVANTEAIARNVEPERAIARTRPLKLLLVDDEELVRMGTADMLADLGHEVEEAASGFAALQILKRADIDLIITDYAMPGMTGAELAAAARLLKPDLPILILTGYANLSEDVGRGVPRLAKPFRQADLAARIASLIEGGNVVAMPGRARPRPAD